MAERRMFAKAVIESGPFLEMSPAAQALYLHLGMLADDDGFVGNPKQVMRMMGASKKAWNQLLERQLLLTFPSGACVLRHWFVHNYIRADRYRDTIYQDEKAQLYLEGNKAYTLTPPPGANASDGIPAGDPLTDSRATQDRENQTKETQNKSAQTKPGETNGAADGASAQARPPLPYEIIRQEYNSTCHALPQCMVINTERKNAIQAVFQAGYTLEDLKRLFRKAQASSFLCGKNERSWTACFDWLLRESNLTRVLEGTFDDRVEDRGQEDFEEVAGERLLLSGGKMVTL